MEEAIKILEEIKKKFEKTMKIIVLGEYSTYVDNSIFEDIKKLINISENLIARYKQLEENESLQKTYDDCYCKYKHYKQFESISVQKVKDKMEELNKEIKSCDVTEAIFKIKQQQILQELLESEV